MTTGSFSLTSTLMMYSILSSERLFSGNSLFSRYCVVLYSRPDLSIRFIHMLSSIKMLIAALMHDSKNSGLSMQLISFSTRSASTHMV